MNPHTTTSNGNQNTFANKKGSFGVGVKIHILFPFQESPKGGGGNQFLKALKDRFLAAGIYEQTPEKADVILFNSHHDLRRVFCLKKKFPEKVFIHRIDGPIQLYRGKDKAIDNLIFTTDKLLADGVIFQSNWSREENRKLYRHFAKYEAVIFNAPDQNIFNKSAKKEFNPKAKIKLIAVSWSANLKKGFEIYKYLDTHLDFRKYEMAFVGNSAVVFKNIKLEKPVPSKELALILKRHDIYITASQSDPCSNSLIEALSCGLPAVALDNGGHPELVQKGGEIFAGKEDILQKIEKVANNYRHYQLCLPEFSLQKVSQQYFDFAKQIFNDTQNGYYFPRQVGVTAALSFFASSCAVFLNRVIDKIQKKT